MVGKDMDASGLSPWHIVQQVRELEQQQVIRIPRAGSEDEYV